MDYALVADHWSQIVRDLKDASKNAYDTEKLAQDILRYTRYTRFRQYNLFTQKRGEEFEKMMEILAEKHTLQPVQDMIADEDFWTITLELASA